MVQLPVEGWKRHQRRRMLPRQRASRTVTGVVAASLILLSVGAVALLSARSRSGIPEGLIESAREYGVAPVELVRSAGRGHRILFMSDVPGAAEPKQLLGDGIEVLAKEAGLDFVGIEAPGDEQRYLDAYLDTKPENAAILLSRPRLLGPSSSAQAMLDVYRRVWKLNSQLGADRQVRLVALDRSGWPPASQRPSALAQAYASRDTAMLNVVESRVLGRHPRARVLLFLSNYHVLKSGRTVLKYAGGQDIPVRPLAALVAQQHPGEVYSLLVDAPPLQAASTTPGALGTTKMFDMFRRAAPELRAPFGMPATSAFNDVREPIYEYAIGGLKVDIEPDSYVLRDVADGYIYLGFGRRAKTP